MVQLKIFRNNEEITSFKFVNEESIRKFIRNIKTTDLKTKSYRFYHYDDLHGKMQLEYFFENTYKPNFYKVRENYIELCIMPNGMHRELQTKSRKTFNNRTLKRTITRVLEESSARLDNNYLKFNNERVHLFKFTKPHTKSENGKIVHIEQFIEIWFDKFEWTYKLGEMSVNDEDFLVRLKKTLDKNTKSLREFRKRRDANNT